MIFVPAGINLKRQNSSATELIEIRLIFMDEQIKAACETDF